jgi:predicted nuclease with TOPRIM domain
MDHSETRPNKRQRGQDDGPNSTDSASHLDHQHLSSLQKVQFEPMVNESVTNQLLSKLRQLEQSLEEKDSRIRELEDEIARLKEEV